MEGKNKSLESLLTFAKLEILLAMFDNAIEWNLY
jgi:hypothetical protein